jgi:hypothetical protein
VTGQRFVLWSDVTAPGRCHRCRVGRPSPASEHALAKGRTALEEQRARIRVRRPGSDQVVLVQQFERVVEDDLLVGHVDADPLAGRVLASKIRRSSGTGLHELFIGDRMP